MFPKEILKIKLLKCSSGCMKIIVYCCPIKILQHSDDIHLIRLAIIFKNYLQILVDIVLKKKQRVIFPCDIFKYFINLTSKEINCSPIFSVWFKASNSTLLHNLLQRKMKQMFWNDCIFKSLIIKRQSPSFSWLSL